MKNSIVLHRKKDENKSIHKPSFFMRPTKRNNETKIEKQISNIQNTLANSWIDNKYKLDLNKTQPSQDSNDSKDINKNNTITLQFNNSVNRLVGLEMGGEVYKIQIEKRLDYFDKNIIIFPDEIEDISITFIQGLTEEIILKIGKYELLNYIEFKGPKNIIEKIHKTIYL